MTSELPANAIPTAADWHRGLVSLTDIADSALREPCFDMSIGRLRGEASGPPPVGSVRALIRLVDVERLAQPAGLIFHTGRCGSTLLANMLGAHRDARVIKEPEILNGLLLHEGSTEDRQEDDDPAPLRAVLAGFARGLSPGKSVVVKCSSWNALDAAHLVRTLPEPRVVFQWRPAAEVIASTVADAPAWFGEGEATAMLRRRLGLGDAVKPVDFHAAAWNAIVSMGVDLAGRFPGRVLIVRYQDLRDRPRGVLESVAEHFALEAGAEHLALMAEAGRHYAKDPAAAAPFDPRGVHARPGLAAPDLERVAALTGEAEAAISRLTATATAPIDAARPGP